MRAFAHKPMRVVMLSWLAVMLFAAWGAYRTHQVFHTSPYWSCYYFVVALLGPLSAFFAWPEPSVLDLVLSVLIALAFSGSAVLYFRKPSRVTASAFLALLAFWLLIGLAIAYAWV
jgi:hypothetical protein